MITLLKRPFLILASLAVFLALPSIRVQTLDDFKQAVQQQGCKAIPYSDLRDTCIRKGEYVEEWCKTKAWKCDGYETQGLLENIKNLSGKNEDVKREKESLESKRSDAKDDSEKRALEDKIAALSKLWDDNKAKIESWQRIVEDKKTEIKNRVYTGEKCRDFRVEVQGIFRDAKSKAGSESDSEIKPYANQLIDKYSASEPGHETGITNAKEGIAKCYEMLEGRR